MTQPSTNAQCKRAEDPKELTTDQGVKPDRGRVGAQAKLYPDQLYIDTGHRHEQGRTGWEDQGRSLLVIFLSCRVPAHSL